MYIFMMYMYMFMMYMYMHMYMFMVYMYVMYMIYVYVNIYVYICTCICISMCMYVYMYIQGRLRIPHLLSLWGWMSQQSQPVSRTLEGSWRAAGLQSVLRSRKCWFWCREGVPQWQLAWTCQWQRGQAGKTKASFFSDLWSWPPEADTQIQGGSSCFKYLNWGRYLTGAPSHRALCGSRCSWVERRH